jgi:hypothetical protein
MEGFLILFAYSFDRHSDVGLIMLESGKSEASMVSAFTPTDYQP